MNIELDIHFLTDKLSNWLKEGSWATVEEKAYMQHLEELRLSSVEQRIERPTIHSELSR